MNRKELRKKDWWIYLEEDLQELFLESYKLLEAVENWDETFHDYSFIVFPAAKAYEGFLKKALFDMRLITEDDYYGKHFRIGRALNPVLTKHPGDSWVFGKLGDFCNGEETPQKLWDTWKLCRNMLFHWFPGERNAISFVEAKDRLLMINEAIDALFGYCDVQ